MTPLVAIAVIAVAILAVRMAFTLRRIEDRQQQMLLRQQEAIHALRAEFDRLTTPAAGAAPPAGDETPQPQVVRGADEGEFETPFAAPPPEYPEPRPLVPLFPPVEEPSPVAVPGDMPPVPEAAAAFTGGPPLPPPLPTFVPPAAPRQPGRFETAAADTLRRIWNWIAVGEDRIPEGVSAEYAFASQWLLRIGIVILVAGIGFFLKWSIDRGLLGPQARVALSTVAGLGMLILGTRQLGGRYAVLGQGLLGGGLATLYFSVYAAHQMFGLVGAVPAFALMAAVTVLAGGIAVRFDSILVAVLGIIGGYGTPLMLATDSVNLPGLFGYLLVLGIGVLAICVWKHWPLVNLLAFLATWLLVPAALRGYETAQFWSVYPLIVGLFVLFSTMTFLHKVLRASPSNVLDVLDMLAMTVNAAVFFGISFWLVDGRFGRQQVAVVSLALAAFYTLHVLWFLRRTADRGLLVSFLGLAAFFVAVTMPLVLSREWITASWALQALVLLWMAERLGSGVVRGMALALFTLVFARFITLDMGRAFLPGGTVAKAAVLPTADYLRLLVGRLVAHGVPIASFGAAARLVGGGRSGGNLGPPAGHRVAGVAAALAGLAALFVYFTLEVDRSASVLCFPAARPALVTLVWLGVGAILLRAFVRTDGPLPLALLACLVAAVLGKVLLLDLLAWDIDERLVVGPAYVPRDAAMRLLDFGAVVAFLAVAFTAVRGRLAATVARPALAIACLGTALFYLTLETNSVLHAYYPGLQAGGVSIVWAIFALALVLAGIARDAWPLRWAGLALFGVVSAKVFLHDLASLDQFWRIVAFVILGLLLLAGSFLYLRFRETFVVATPDGGRR